MTAISVPLPRHPSAGATGRDPVPLTGALCSIVGGLALLVSFVVVPGPDVADIHDSGWVPGHVLSAVGFGLLALGLPALAGSLGRRLGVPGVIGYLALMARFVLSTGSHLYSLWILPHLAPVATLHHQLQADQRLASIYAGHGDWFNAVIGAALFGLVYSLARCGRGARTATVLIGIAAISETIGFPFGLALLAVVAIWFGTRLIRHGDVLTPLHAA